MISLIYNILRSNYWKYILPYIKKKEEIISVEGKEDKHMQTGRHV